MTWYDMCPQYGKLPGLSPDPVLDSQRRMAETAVNPMYEDRRRWWNAQHSAIIAKIRHHALTPIV